MPAVLMVDPSRQRYSFGTTPFLRLRHPGPDAAGFCTFDGGCDKRHPFNPIIDCREVAIGRDRLAVNFSFYGPRCLDINIGKRLNKSFRVAEWKTGEPFCDGTDVFIATPIDAPRFVTVPHD